MTTVRKGAAAFSQLNLIGYNEINGYIVEPIRASDTYPFLLSKHYAKRVPSITHAFGLFDNSGLIGVITYGSPSSSPLRQGVCGPDYSQYVIELNRLCLLNNKKNEASILVGRSLKLLPKPKIVVSFADSQQGHVGYIYQACNFIYSGLSAKRTDWKIKGAEKAHGQSIADEFKGKNRAKAMRQKYGDDFYLEERSRKHRYLYFLGSKKDKKKMLDALRYKIEPYPKSALL